MLPPSSVTKDQHLFLDQLLMFRKPTDAISTKAKRRLNVLRALTHTNYGHSKEHIATVLKQFIGPILTYVHTAWQPLLSSTNFNKLQITLKRVYACLQATPKQQPPITSIKNKKVLKIQDHMEMRRTHAYTSYTEPQHPLYYLTEGCHLNRNKWKAPANYYSNFYSTLPSAPRNTSPRTNIHTCFAKRGMYALK